MLQSDASVFIMPPLADSVKRIRLRLGKSQAAFASMLGLQRNTVTRYENGRVTPTFVVLMQLRDLAATEEKAVFIAEMMRQLAGGEVVITGYAPTIRRGGSAIEALAAAAALDNPALEALREQRPCLAGIIDLVIELADRGQEVDDSLVEILRLWLSVGAKDTSARKYFVDAARFLELALASRDRG